MKAFLPIIALSLVFGTWTQAQDTLLEIPLSRSIPIGFEKQYHEGWTKRTGLPADQAALDARLRLRQTSTGISSRAWFELEDLPGVSWPVTVTGKGPFSLSFDIPSTRYFRYGRWPEILAGGSIELQVTLKDDKATWSVTSTATTETHDERAERWGIYIKKDLIGQKVEGDNLRYCGAIRSGNSKGSSSFTRIPAPLIGGPTPGPGVHPRLLFTKKDIPRLKQTLETPLGTQVMDYLKEALRRYEAKELKLMGFDPLWGVGYGVMFQLTGDPIYAKKAEETAWLGMNTVLAANNGWRQSHRIAALALIYDLCYEAWGEEFRSNVYHYLLAKALEFSLHEGEWDPLGFGMRYTYSGQTFSPLRTYQSGTGMGYMAAAALAAMAIAHDPGPTLSAASDGNVLAIEPLKNFAPPIGVPVNLLYKDFAFKNWLGNGPFPISEGDPYADKGGVGQLHPRPGDRITVMGQELDWRPIYLSGSNRSIRGPHLYPRSDMKYLVSSTGSGYPPGREIRNLLKQKVKEDPSYPTQLCTAWYSVWDNDVDGYIQAMPNWGWTSRGVRMWINGQEVVDGQIVKLEKGLYTVNCWVPITGGYNNQAPHFKRISEEDFQRLQRSTEGGSALAPELRDRLLQALRRHGERGIDSKGWHGSNSQYLMAAALQAAKHSEGIDLTPGTGWRHFGTLAKAVHPLLKKSSNRHMVAALAPFMEPGDRGAAWDLIDTYGLGINLPPQALLTLTGILQTERTEASSVPLARHYDQAGMWSFANKAERSESGDFLITLEQGLPPMSTRFRVGSLAIDATNVLLNKKTHHSWSNYFAHGGNSIDDTLSPGTGAYVKGMHPAGPGKIVSQMLNDDGSGAVSLEYQMQERLLNDQGKAYDGALQEGVSVQRSVYVDWIEEGAVVVLVDRFRGLKQRHAKGVFFAVGRNGHAGHQKENSGLRIYRGNKPAFTLYNPNDVIKRGKRGAVGGGGQWFQARFFAPRDLEVRRTMAGKNPWDTMVKVVMDRVIDGGELGRKPGKKTGREMLGGETGFDDELDSILAGDDLGGEGNDHRIISVITITNGKHPPSKHRKEGDDDVISVGEIVYRFDGQGIVRQ